MSLNLVATIGKRKMVFYRRRFVAYRPRTGTSGTTSRANRYLICDTSPLTTLFYTLDNMVMPRKNFTSWRSGNTLWCALWRGISLCAGWHPARRGVRARQQAWYEQELSRRNIPYLRFRVRCKSDWGKFFINFPAALNIHSIFAFFRFIVF